MGDVIAAIYSETYNLPGDHWVIGEAVFADPEEIRDLRVDQQFPVSEQEAPDIGHQYGKVFGNAMYRLKQKGVSLEDLTKILLEIANEVQPLGGRNQTKMDHYDFVIALQNAATKIGGTSMRSKADEVIEEMTVPANAPGKQSSLEQCIGGMGVYSITYWQSTSGGYADSFELQRQIGSSWVQENTGPATCIPFNILGTKKFRVRGSNDAGDSPWSIMTVHNSCLGL